MIWRRPLALVPVLAFAAAAQTATTTVLSAPSNTSAFGAGVTLTATVTPSGATGKVTFYDGTSILGIRTLSAGSAALTTRLLGVGARTLSAHYDGDSSHAASRSANVAHTVTATPAGGFQPVVPYAAGTAPDGVAVADFNGDGVLDMAVSGLFGTVNVFLGNGDGTFQPAVPYTAGAAAAAIVAADFNGDGNMDLAVSDYTDRGVSILLGNGNGTFQSAVLVPVSTGAMFAVVADFDGNGTADLAVANQTGLVTVLLGNGDGTFQSLTSFSTNPCTLAAVGDFNGDGVPDLVGGYVNGGICVQLGSGSGTFQSPVLYPYNGESATNQGGIATGDFNGDGKPDVAVSFVQFGVAVFLGDGHGGFQPPIATGTQSYGGYLATGDFNGDGMLDIAISDFDNNSGVDNGAAAVLLGNGSGTFQSPVLYGAGVPPSYALAVADFNGDGRSDLAVTSYGPSGNTVGVLLGQSAAAGAAVSAVSVSPAFGSGASQTFTFTFSDTAGAADLTSVQVLFGFDNQAVSGSCVITYNVAQQTLILWNDDGTIPAVGPTPGSGFVQNSQCLLNAATSSAVLAGNQLTLSVTIGFRFRGGERSTYGEATSTSGITTGWQQLGTWMGVEAPPQAVSVSPANSTAALQYLTFTFTDAASAADIYLVYVNLNTTTSTVNSCLIEVSPVGGSIMLANDADNTWSSGTLGSGPSLYNNQCAVFPALSSATLQANTYVLTLYVQQTPPGVYTWNIYGAANTPYVSSGYQTLGTWTAGPGPESITLVAAPNPVVVGQPVTMTATAGGVISGNLTFYDGATVLGVAPIVNNIATFSTILLSTGAHKLTAHNPSSFYFTSTVSDAAAVTVQSVPGSLQPFATLNAGNSPTSVVVGDFNGDGIADLAVTNQLDDNVSVFLGLGNGSFQAGATYSTAAGPFGLAVGDFNQDGAQDLAVATGAGVSVLLNNNTGNGTFQAQQSYTAGSNGATVLATGDFNNSGWASLAAGGFGSDELMQGFIFGQFFGVGQIIAPSSGGVVVGDFNGDGNADVAVAALQGGGLFVLPGNGNFTFQSAAVYTTPFSPAGILNSLVLADFNGDGISDLAMSTASGVSILLGNRDGSFQTPVLYPAGAHPAALAVGDINGDGIADLVVANASMSGSGNTLNILLGNGNGTFRPAVSFPVSDSQVGLALADFNGDGRLDLAVANFNSKTVSILLGTSVAACKVTAGTAIGVTDLQQMMNEALGVSTPIHDLNGDGAITVVDVQIVTSADLGWACTAH